MDKLKPYCRKRTLLLVGIAFVTFYQNVYCQLNCEALFEKDSPEYCACRLMYDEINTYDQGSKESQLLCDSALSICPTFPEAYYIKAIPYLKRGEFDIWKALIDKAVEYDSVMYIGYRGGAQFMFLRHYEEAINDINKLEALLQSDDLGTIYNGEYDLQVIRALSYKGLGDKDKAIALLERHFNNYDAGLYGYYHLGALYFEENRYSDAIETFVKQSAHYDFADTNYYLALAYKNTGENDKYKKTIQKAYDLYLGGRRLRGNESYMDYPDKVYLEQIKQAMIQLK